VDAVNDLAGGPADKPGDDFAAKVRAAQADIAQGVERAGWRDDPLRHPMAALSTTVGVFPPLVERMEAIAAGMKRPISDDEFNRLQSTIIRGADRRAAELARAHNLRTVLWISAAIGGAFVLGVGLDQAVAYARAPSYDVIRLAGNALLCRADGVRVDADGVRYAPIVKMMPEPTAHR